MNDLEENVKLVKSRYPEAFAERLMGGGCMIRQSLRWGVVIGYAHPGNHVDAWRDAANRIREKINE